MDGIEVEAITHKYGLDTGHELRQADLLRPVRPYLLIERILPEQFTRAKQLRIRFRDKLRISFTDLTTMAVM